MKQFDHSYTDEIVCPYCGCIDRDSWEVQPDSADMQCGDCGETFDYNRIITIQYETFKKENNCEHTGKIFCDECGKKMEDKNE